MTSEHNSGKTDEWLRMRCHPILEPPITIVIDEEFELRTHRFATEYSLVPSFTFRYRRSSAQKTLLSNAAFKSATHIRTVGGSTRSLSWKSTAVCMSVNACTTEPFRMGSSLPCDIATHLRKKTIPPYSPTMLPDLPRTGSLPLSSHAARLMDGPD